MKKWTPRQQLGTSKDIRMQKKICRVPGTAEEKEKFRAALRKITFIHVCRCLMGPPFFFFFFFLFQVFRLEDRPDDRLGEPASIHYAKEESYAFFFFSAQVPGICSHVLAQGEETHRRMTPQASCFCICNCWFKGNKPYPPSLLLLLLLLLVWACQLAANSIT